MRTITTDELREKTVEYCKKNNIKLIEIAYNDNIKVSMDNILKVVNNDAYSRGNY